MRKRWFFAAAAVVVFIGLAAFFGQRAYHQREQAQVQLAEWEQLQRLEAALERPVEIKFSGPVSLTTWLTEFTRQTGVPTKLHDPENLLPPDFQVNLTVTSQSARSALQLLAREANLHWRLEEQGTIGVYYYTLPLMAPRDHRVYPLRPTFTPQVQQQIAAAVIETIEPDSWEDVGGPGTLIAHPDQLLIVQRYDLHLRIRKFLDALQLQLEQAAALPARDLSASDPRLAIHVLDSPFVTRDRLLASLDKTISIDGAEMPLQSVISTISEQLGVTIVLPAKLEGELGEVMLNEPITLRAANLPARTVLKMVLDPFGCRVVPAPQDEVLLVQLYDWGTENQVTVAYPIPDFVGPNSPDARSLTDIMTYVVQPDTWQDVGGPGSLRVIDRLLLVTQHEDVFPQIDGFLHALRTVRAGEQKWASAVLPSPKREQMLQVLERPLNLQYEEVPLRTVMADVATRSGLSIVLAPNIEEAGQTPDSPVTCDLAGPSLSWNLRHLLAKMQLTYTPQDDYVAIIALERIHWPTYHRAEIVDARALLHGNAITFEKLNQLLTAAVEPDSWENVGGPGSIDELHGLLVITNRPELQAQVRHVLDAIEDRLLKQPATIKHRNLATRTPADDDPRAPRIHLYDVADLLTPGGDLSPEALIKGFNPPLPKKPGVLAIPHFEIHCDRFLVAYLHAADVGPLEAKFRELRSP